MKEAKRTRTYARRLGSKEDKGGAGSKKESKGIILDHKNKHTLELAFSSIESGRKESYNSFADYVTFAA